MNLVKRIILHWNNMYIINFFKYLNSLYFIKRLKFPSCHFCDHRRYRWNEVKLGFKFIRIYFLLIYVIFIKSFFNKYNTDFLK